MIKKNRRQDELNRLQARQRGENDWFFDKFDNVVERAVDRPVRWIGFVVLLNLLFFLVIIAAACFGLWLVFG